MTVLVTRRFHALADTLAELKVKLRAALATELAGAVGTAIRDVLVVTLLDRLVAAPGRTTVDRAPAHGWREEYPHQRDRWDEPRDPWDDGDYDSHPSTPSPQRESGQPEPSSMPVVPAAAALAVGVNVGRWWLTRQGSIAAALGLGTLATVLGLAGGPVASAVLAVLAATTDVLTAEAVLARVA